MIRNLDKEFIAAFKRKYDDMKCNDQINSNVDLNIDVCLLCEVRREGRIGFKKRLKEVLNK